MVFHVLAGAHFLFVFSLFLSCRPLRHLPRVPCGGVNAEYADADARLDAFEVGVKRSCVGNDLSFGRRGVEQVQLAVVVPKRQSLMAVVETVQGGDDADDVAVVDVLQF